MPGPQPAPRGQDGARTQLEAVVDGLLRDVRAGDEAALDRLCRVLAGRMRQVARKAMGPVARRWVQHEDVVQQVLAEEFPAFSARDSSLPASAILGRLCNRTRWRVIDIVRAHEHDRGWSHVEPDGQLLASSLSGHLDRREVLARIEARLAALPPLDAEIVRLVGLEMRTFVEAASRLGSFTPDAVRKRYARAVRTLEDVPES
jgi:DNA-directed RNA polymerase specialized sigma24 family protein